MSANSRCLPDESRELPKNCGVTIAKQILGCIKYESYPGNGPSPTTAITAPGAILFSISLSSGNITWTFNESNGTSVTFYYLTGDIFFIPGQVSCSSNPPPCDPGGVGQTPGATESGVVNGTFNPLPQIQTVITAGSYGGSASIAPATWIEIYGINVGTTLGYERAGSDFHGSNAPTALAGTTVTVGGQLAFVDYVSPGQVNAQVPSNIGTGQQPVVVTTAGGSGDPFSVNVNTTQPGLLASPAFDIKGTIRRGVVSQSVLRLAARNDRRFSVQASRSWRYDYSVRHRPRSAERRPAGRGD